MERPAAVASYFCYDGNYCCTRMYLCMYSCMYLCTYVCGCVFSSHSFWTSSSLDVPAGVTQEEGHTRISHPPFCGACLNFSREKDSAIPFPRRP